jgi:dTDP-4-amino-4,6-dideoxygalactose transaminase
VTAELERTLLGLPFHVFLSEEDVGRMATALAQALPT